MPLRGGSGVRDGRRSLGGVVQSRACLSDYGTTRMTDFTAGPELDELVARLIMHDVVEPYSTDMGAAWKVLKRVVELGRDIDIAYSTGACASPDPDEMPTIICIAALETVR